MRTGAGFTWMTRFTGAGGIARLATALAVALVATACAATSPAGTVPPPALTTPYPSVLAPAPTPAPTAEPVPSPTATPFRLGSAGDVVLVQVTDAAEGAGSIVIVTAVSPETGVQRTATRRFTVPKGWQLDAGAGGAISPNGSTVALELMADDGTGAGAAILSLLPGAAEGAEAEVLPGSSPTWLPDGSLELYTGGTAEDPGTLSRYLPGETTAASVIVEDVFGVSFYRTPTSFVMTADGSGVFGGMAGTSETDDPVIVHWDGSVIVRSPGTAPLFNTGTERPDAADGSRAIGGCDSSPSGSTCANTWIRPDGTWARIRTGDADVAWWTAWTPEGTTLVLVDQAVRTARDGGGDTIRSTVAARLPASDAGYTLAGLTDSLAVVEVSSGGPVYLVDLAGGGITQVLQGTFAGMLR